MKKNIKITYDPEADILSWETGEPAKIDYATEMGNIIVHFTKGNKPILIEVLEASKVMRKTERVFEKAQSAALSR